ncbi:unnamed protein product [Spirodela intermedia]|uniref:Uncharacterized protein n=1 Tax=Spirodela intermedia TaxID=51605 RepID=A0A7I8LDZ5_SPIIN|nr:unnamed protein product [Spirodela intermedia]
MVKLMSAAGTLGSDPQLESTWWPIMAYLSTSRLSLRLAQWHHTKKPLAAVYNLRVLAQAFQAWRTIIALQHLGGTAPTGLQLRTANLPCSLLKNR